MFSHLLQKGKSETNKKQFLNKSFSNSCYFVNFCKMSSYTSLICAYALKIYKGSDSSPAVRLLANFAGFASK